MINKNMVEKTVSFREWEAKQGLEPLVIGGSVGTFEGGSAVKGAIEATVDAPKRMSKADKESEQKRCREDLKYLCVEYLGYSDWDVCHDDLAKWLKDAEGSRYKLLLIPRGHLKSSILTVGYSIQCILREPNIRILIAHATWDNARGFLREISKHIGPDSKLEEVFGKFKAKNWTRDSLTVGQRTRALAAPTVATTGIERTQASQHYDCLLPDTEILTSNGYVKVKDIKIGHRVLGSDGRFNEVQAKVKKISDKGSVYLRAGYQSKGNWFTYDHKLLVFRNNVSQWVEAKAIKSSDYFMIPRCNRRNGVVSKVNKRLSHLLKVPAIWRLIGYWLAEGCHTPDGGQVRLTFSNKEHSYVEDVCEIVKAHLGVNVSARDTGHSTIIVCFSDKDFKEIIKKFGSRASDKHIPPFAINTSAKFQKELILGYWRGDGCITDVVSFTSISENLLTGIQLILAKLGMQAGISQGKRAGKSIVVGNECNVSDSYIMSSSSNDLKLMLGLNTQYSSLESRSYFLKDYWLVPIWDIKSGGIAGEVYDIQTRSHDFYCRGMIAHNCIILDDVVTRENISTKEQREKVKKFYKDCLSLLEPTGNINIIGTTWHEDDLYNDLRKNPKYKLHLRTALEPPSFTKGEPIFPKKFSAETLKGLKEELGPFEFSSQYFLNPYPDEDMEFRPEWFSYYAEIPKVPMYVSMVLDPSLGKDTSDFSGLTTTGVCGDGKIYILDARHFKAKPELIPIEVVKAINDLRRKGVYVGRFGLESIAFQQILQPMIDEAFKLNGLKIPIDLLTLHTQAQSKDVRIQGLISYFSAKRVYLRRDMTDLTNELLKWKRGSKNKADDIIDSLAYQIRYWGLRPHEMPKETAGEGSLLWWMNKMKQNKKADLFSEYRMN